MLGTIRKHQTWLWVVIITLTIISFVIFGPTNTSIGNFFNGRGGEQFGTLDGQAITLRQYQQALQQVYFESLLRNETTFDNNSPEVQKDTYLRIFLAKKAKDAGIQISTAAIASRIHQVFGEVSLETIEEKILKPNGMTLSDLNRFYRDQLAVEQMVMTAGLSGKLVTPQEAETMYRLENQDLDSMIVYFSASNYLASVPSAPQSIRQFYTNQLANYRVPEQVQVEYVRFDITNYDKTALAALTNIDQLVATNVEHMGTNLFPGSKTAAESKVAVRNEIIRRRALVSARQAASDYAEALDKKLPHAVENMQTLATNGMIVRTTAPFERTYGPQEFIAPADFAKKAFGLDTNDVFAGPIVGDQAVFVIGLKARILSYIPAFEQIQAKVATDFNSGMAMQFARQAAVDFYSKITNTANAGKTFNAICAEAHVRPQSLAPFSVSARTLPNGLDEKVDVGMFKQIAFNTPIGKSSPPVGARDGAFILYVDKILPFNDTKMKTELPEFLAYLRTTRQNDAFNQWFNQQIRNDAGFASAIQSKMQTPQPRTTKTTRRTKS